MAVSMNDVRKFFGYESLTQFRQEWMLLTDEDKRQLKAGLEDQTFTY